MQEAGIQAGDAEEEPVDPPACEIVDMLGGDDAEEEPEPPPVPVAPRVIKDAADRIYFNISGAGRIVYYISRQEFYAECPLRGTQHHRLCRRIRTAKPSVFSARHAQGRPLGHLMCWIQSASQHANSDSHKTCFHSTYAERKAARQALKLLPGSHVLFARERPLSAEEDSEPDVEA